MKKIVAFLLAALMLLSLLPVFASAEEAEKNAEDEAAQPEPGYHAEEVIYGVLSPEGDVNKLLPVVVIDAAEEKELEYYGSFAEVKNLTDTDKLESTESSVKLSVPQGRFYFEAELEGAQLPWLIDIDYSLDGEKISPDKLGGKDGRLEIGISIKPNPNGDQSFFDAYILQISMTLDSLKCRNIQGEGATMANAGSNKMVNFMAMPGMETELKLTADVNDFSMGGISIAAVPSSMADMLDGMGGIAGGIDSFGDSMNELSQGVAMLAGGAGELRDGFGMFGAGLMELSNNSQALVGGSEQILNGLRQISDIVAALQGMGPDIDMGSLAFIPEVLYDLADTLDYAAEALGGSGNRMDEALSAMSSLLNQVIEIPEAELEALWAQNPGNSALESLIVDYRILIGVRDTWYQAEEIFRNAALGLDATVGYLTMGAKTAREIASGIENMDGSGSIGGMGELGEYIDQLAGLGDSYAMFHEGLVQYTGGVDALAQAAVPLYGGTDMLASGTEQLNEGTSQIPDSIDGMMESLAGDEFENHSFISDKNKNVQSVQFVMTTEGIKPEVKAEDNTEPVQEKTGISLFFQRLSDLFNKNQDSE